MNLYKIENLLKDLSITYDKIIQEDDGTISVLLNELICSSDGCFEVIKKDLFKGFDFDDLCDLLNYLKYLCKRSGCKKYSDLDIETIYYNTKYNFNELFCKREHFLDAINLYRNSFNLRYSEKTMRDLIIAMIEDIFMEYTEDLYIEGSGISIRPLNLAIEDELNNLNTEFLNRLGLNLNFSKNLYFPNGAFVFSSQYFSFSADSIEELKEKVSVYSRTNRSDLLKIKEKLYAEFKLKSDRGDKYGVQ